MCGSAYVCVCCVRVSVCDKEDLCISAKEPYIIAKEPYMQTMCDREDLCVRELVFVLVCVCARVCVCLCV